MIWNAFSSVEDAMVGSLKYDPYGAKGPISKLRSLKHYTIWKSLKEFRLDPGHEVVGRFKVKQENIVVVLYLKKQCAVQLGSRFLGHECLLVLC